MKQVILLRYGELFLKGRNKRFFETALINNIKKALNGIEYTFIKTQNRYYIEDYPMIEQESIIDKLKKVFGLHSLSIATKTQTTYDNLTLAAINAVDLSKNTFRISVNRADKNLDKTSTQIAAFLGGKVLEKYPNMCVDLTKPQQDIQVDIREQGYSYVFGDKILCAQGMPSGTAGRGMLLLSGGFDSPVAGYRMARRGMEIYAIHFHSYPHTSLQAKQKVIDLAKTLSVYSGKIKLFCVPFTHIQEAIHKNCNPDFMIAVMRRLMMKISERVAINNGCGAIITGESLGQVASQTVQSIMASNDAIQHLPMFRPLIGMDKYEIMDTANLIGTFKLSELPYEDCCTVFLPKNPVIKPTLESVIHEQDKISKQDSLIEDAINNIEIIDITPSY